MGILNPTEWSQFEYETSKDITSQLSNLIYKQDLDISKLDKEKMDQSKKNWKKARENIYKEEVQNISSNLDDRLKKLFVASQEKGSSS